MINHTLEPTIKRALEMASFSGNYKAIIYIPGSEFWVVNYPDDNSDLLKNNPIVYTVSPDGMMYCAPEFILE